MGGEAILRTVLATVTILPHQEATISMLIVGAGGVEDNRHRGDFTRLVPIRGALIGRIMRLVTIKSEPLQLLFLLHTL